MSEYEPASLSKRFLALVIDWIGSSAIATLFTRQTLSHAAHGEATLVPLLIFTLEIFFFTATVGGSVGQIILRVRVVDLGSGNRISFLKSLARAILISLVIPPLLTYQGRGLHDRLTNSMAIEGSHR
jgi:uncharacterized RDD family membrane protein YckC